MWFLHQEKGIKPDLNYSVKCFNFSMRCGLCPPITLFMESKERHKSCMNCASLDRVLWTSTNRVNCDVNFRISCRFKTLRIYFAPWHFMQSVFKQFYYCIEITFTIFERLVFTFWHRGPNWFPGNEDMIVPIKLAISLIDNFGFVGMMQHFS